MLLEKFVYVVSVRLIKSRGRRNKKCSLVLLHCTKHQVLQQKKPLLEASATNVAIHLLFSTAGPAGDKIYGMGWQ